MSIIVLQYINIQKGLDMKKLLIIIIIALFMFVGCDDTNTKELTKKEQLAVEAIEVIQEGLNDTESMRIYGDILKVDFINVDGVTYCITYSSKNLNGAYEGKINAEIITSFDLDTFYVTDNTEYYMDLKSMFMGVRKIPQTDIIEYEILDGQRIADEMNLEYFD